MHILVLDTADGSMAGLLAVLQSAPDRHTVQVCRTSAEMLAAAGGNGVDLLMLDFPDGTGRRAASRTIKALRRDRPQTPIIATAGAGDVRSASVAIRDGATDFLVRGDELAARVQTLLGKIAPVIELLRENSQLQEERRRLSEEGRDRYQIVGESPVMIDLLRRLRRVAAIPRPVLIVGERGTGKELVARAIHLESGRASKPIVCINCAALPPELLESELFGHERGSFTGAHTMSPGKFELADGGTLFLDEIGNMTLPFQQKILRVLEYGTFTRVGGKKELHTSARILAATNADLRERIAEGRFLADLHDRLAFEVLEVPPLRARGPDIELLAQHILHQFMREIPSLQGKRLSREAIDALRRYPFPGNVRELKNIIERAAYRDSTNEITPDDLGLESAEHVTHDSTATGTFEERLNAHGARLVRQALRESGGNGADAARRLGLPYHRLRYLLRKYRLDRRPDAEAV